MRRLLSVVAIASLLGLSWGRPAVADHKKPKPAQKAKAKPKHHEEYERPVAVYTRDGRPNIQAESAVVVDIASKKELLDKHADDVRPIASISKLMAMIVVLERKLNLDGITEMLASDRDLARRGAKSRLPTGMTFTNRDLLHAALMASDNRAVPALGRAVGLNPEAMTAAMNQKARDLGLSHTTFGDPTGLDDRNRSTPREVAKMLIAALQLPLVTEITRKAKYVAQAVSKPGYKIEYTNTDVIARGGKYSLLAGKTGYTDLAGYCLAIAARIGEAGAGHEVAMVFLGEHGKLTRFGDFSRVAQWVTEKKPTPGATAVAAKPATATKPPAAAIASPPKK